MAQLPNCPHCGGGLRSIWIKPLQNYWIVLIAASVLMQKKRR